MANPTSSNKPKDMLSDAKDKAQETAHNVADAASSVGHKVSEVASNVGHKVSDVASGAGKKADSAVSAAGRGMESFADTVRDRGPQSGMMGKATSAVADTLDNAGEYLESHGLSGIAGDLTDLVRRNPIPALLIGIGVGYLLARATRS